MKNNTLTSSSSSVEPHVLTGLLFDLSDEIIQVIQQAQKLLVEESSQKKYAELHQFECSMTAKDNMDAKEKKSTEVLATTETAPNRSFVPYSILKQAIQVVNRFNKNNKEKLYLHKLIKKSRASFPEPPPPPPKDPKFLRRLAQLQKAYDDTLYAQMVANVNFRQRREQERDPFSTYKGQLGVGLDLIVTVFTFFVIFYFITSTVFGFHDHTDRLIGGLIGAVLGLFVDALLVIIRGGRAEELQKKKLSKRSGATAAHVGTARKGATTNSQQ